MNNSSLLLTAAIMATTLNANADQKEDLKLAETISCTLTVNDSHGSNTSKMFFADSEIGAFFLGQLQSNKGQVNAAVFLAADPPAVPNALASAQIEITVENNGERVASLKAAPSFIFPGQAPTEASVMIGEDLYGVHCESLN